MVVNRGHRPFPPTRKVSLEILENWDEESIYNIKKIKEG